MSISFLRHRMFTFFNLQPSQVKCTPQCSINELIIQKLNSWFSLTRESRNKNTESVESGK